LGITEAFLVWLCVALSAQIPRRIVGLDVQTKN
jgi:hypothetical protein